MVLEPNQPPGHARRKLRKYVDEIARLRSMGYTIEAIHQALLDANLSVSWSAVQREVARLAPARQTPHRPMPPAPPPPATTPSRAQALPPVPTLGADDVDAFFAAHITNPLLKKKGNPR